MQKITLKPGEAVEINGAIIGMEIVDFLLDCQLGIVSPGTLPGEQNSGIEEYKKEYNNLILFLASEASSFDDKEDLIAWFDSINALRNMWNKLRIPGTKVSKY